MKQYRSLVTGGAGFIGSHVVETLVKSGDRVRVLDDFSTGFRTNLDGVRDDVEVIRGTICNPDIVRKAIKGMDYVFHLAANRAVLHSVENPRHTNDVNITGMLNILIAARDEDVRRVIFSSSSSIYGDTKKFPSAENDRPAPASPYAVSKLVGEYYCQLFSQLYDLATVSLRYFNVFGPRQNPESRYSAVIPIFIECLISNQRPEVHWDGRQSRDFSYVDNVAHANLRARSIKQVSGDVFNISTQEERSVLEILDELKHILKKPLIKPRFAPKRAGDVRRTYANIRKAKQVLGFQVQTRFKEGLEKTAEWFQQCRSMKKGSR